MDLQELLNRLQLMGLNRNNLEDVYVTSLYIDLLEDAYRYFTQPDYRDMSGNQCLFDILGDNYGRVNRALQNPQILIRLCRKLNVEYAWQAVLNRALSTTSFRPQIDPNLTGERRQQQLGTQFREFRNNRPEYEKFFLNSILDDEIFPGIPGMYQRTFQALPIVQDNYKRSIGLCCQRVVNDWTNINQVFLPQRQMTAITEIQSTGSDTHKYGQEVLILKFACQTANFTPATQRNVQIVYKPRDIEIDALICGNSDSLRDIGCLTNNEFTLFDHLNQQINIYNQQNNANIQPLFTYRFLPIVYGSLPNSSIENSYGYVEFLSHEDEDFNTRLTDNQRVIENFYTSIGQLMAITSLFSMCDIHKENLRVHQYQPCLVDLENSLVNRCTNLNRIGFVKRNDISALRGLNSENRLYNGQNVIRPELYAGFIQNGFRCMSQIIYSSINPNNSLLQWFVRLQNVVSRQIPIGTGAFVYKKRLIYNYQNCREPVDQIPIEIDQYFTREKDNAYNNWYTATNNVINPSIDIDTFRAYSNGFKTGYWRTHTCQIELPTFYVYNQNYIQDEYMSLDVPSYYHRISTQNLVNFNGNVIQVTIPNYVQQEQWNTFESIMVNTNYFCYPDNLSPTDVIVNCQLQIDKNTFDNNIDTFIAQLQHFLLNPNEYEPQN